MRTHVEFSSMAFPPYPGESDEINPGRFGKRLAEFLKSSLAEHGYATNEIFAEDWGWVVPIQNDSFSCWVGCANHDDLQNGFLCFIEPSKPTIRKWFKTIDTTQVVSKLSATLDEVLSNANGISNIRWWSESEH